MISRRISFAFPPRSFARGTPLAVLAALGLLGGCRHHTPTTAVTIEVFQVAFADDAIQYRRIERQLGGPNAPTPDAAVHDALGDGARTVQSTLYHSTSWHFRAPNEIVLTYLATYSAIPSQQRWQTVKLVELPGVLPVDPLKPEPRNLDELKVLSHGLSHLAFLLRRDDSSALKEAVGMVGERALSRLTPRLAGELPK